eukprot:gnl/TRDRNA2_/TRDRNA2_41213_c0_seq1.p1 gnl/TRDRNA2_/TRDRNA2_41213_c0~~gnl/TRDRNA2_/TRDRNA2_41213_c0_seq1.p1  ORF type:complete len:175 (+),score=18.23 gnl/TRDRNA2_/TRDRNA2_41213_c0_seq1:152-676(+)
MATLRQKHGALLFMLMSLSHADSYVTSFYMDSDCTDLVMSSTWTTVGADYCMDSSDGSSVRMSCGTDGKWNFDEYFSSGCLGSKVRSGWQLRSLAEEAGTCKKLDSSTHSGTPAGTVLYIQYDKAFSCEDDACCLSELDSSDTTSAPIVTGAAVEVAMTSLAASILICLFGVFF